MKKILSIEIECEEFTCGKCDYLFYYKNKDGFSGHCCRLFNNKELKGTKDYNSVRCDECMGIRKEEKKSCPFCGGKAVSTRDTTFEKYWVFCERCHASIDKYESEEEAIAVWNRRMKVTLWRK
jgi:Lar family restriction alleviation protein